jgi:hypothetical protein
MPLPAKSEGCDAGGMVVVGPSADLVISVGCVGREQHPGLICAIESSRCRRPEPGVDNDDRCAAFQISSEYKVQY